MMLLASSGFCAQALAFDPGNVTARRRLAEIAVAGGEKSGALGALQQAYAREASNGVTNHLLREVR